MTFIAEIKPFSPFSGPSRYSMDVLRFTALQHGDWVAAHTDPRWHGSIEHLAETRAMMDHLCPDKPLLAKGIHATDQELVEVLQYAHFALVVGRWPSHLPAFVRRRLIFEPSDFHQLKKVMDETLPSRTDPEKVMWNSRDLETGERRSQDYSIREVKIANDGNLDWVCQASFIREPGDVMEWADAHIVGTDLMHFVHGELR